MKNPENQAFVKEYEAAYKGQVPASYAFQAYDAALLIDSALKQTKGSTKDKDALRAALMKADFKSPRGPFKFNTNHYPVQDFYLVKVGQRPDGKFETQIVQKVFSNYADTFAKDCPMK
jgi:branched-chain amino acid transport system substrate-binding protein